jgi:hypothetical protein
MEIARKIEKIQHMSIEKSGKKGKKGELKGSDARC